MGRTAIRMVSLVSGKTGASEVLRSRWRSRYLESGIEFQPLVLSEQNDDGLFQQLEDDGLIERLDQAWMLSWRSVYDLKAREDYAAIQSNIGLPPVIDALPHLGSRGSLTDTDF